ncbi:MAG: cation:proton antiporter, partial [Candidatus Woesebacteria bacterium]|nr:cation:proton antiporter [Candidatus Woesebacteria bacterium]
MVISFTLALFIVLSSALMGGYIAKRLKFQPIIGYILAGVITSAIFPISGLGIEKLAEIGGILLLFSIGLELSVNKFKNILKKILIASVLQMLLVTVFLFFVLRLFGFSNISSFVLAIGFSLSSTAVVVKTLFDRGESETIHGKLMIGWLLVQDLAVIPIMVILPILASNQESVIVLGGIAILKAIFLIVASIVLGKHVVPFFVHKITILNSRELLVLTSIALAVGTAVGVSFFGISATLGAFIAGFVISESQENHAIFAEVRPLRDLFVALFFVTLGFFVSFPVIISHLGVILVLAIIVILLKFIVVSLINYLLKFSGKTMIISAIGLAQVGEFSFIIFSTAAVLKLIPSEIASIGIAVSLVTLILTPFIYKKALPLWKLLRSKFKIFSSLERNPKEIIDFSDHIIICGYGRVGGWIGRALQDKGIKFVVIDYNQEIVNSCLKKGISAIYGDPVEKEVLQMANITSAKAIVIAIPDRLSHESIIAHVETLAPNVKIISRVHLDEDYEKFRSLRV